jgi:hypothetical protein
MTTGQSKQGRASNQGVLTTFASGFWAFMRSAFVFFERVLDAVKDDSRLTILWGFAVLLLVVLISVLVLANDLAPLAKLILAVVVILTLVALFLYTIPRVRATAAPPPAELIARLSDRAAIVEQRLENKRQSLSGARRGGRRPASDAARATRLKAAQGQFSELFPKHIEALKRGQYVRAHEICRTIQQTLSDANKDFVESQDTGLIYHLSAISSQSIEGLYPGPRPHDLPESVAPDLAAAIWPESGE